jgi:hypothetical protein
VVLKRRVWLALGIPPVAWFAAQNVAYFFVSWACARRGGEVVLHAIALGGVAACALSAWLAWSVLREIGARGDDDHDDGIQRTRFLCRLAIAGAIVLGLVVVVMWLAMVILDPCLPMPRSRFSPDA